VPFSRSGRPSWCSSDFSLSLGPGRALVEGVGKNRQGSPFSAVRFALVFFTVHSSWLRAERVESCSRCRLDRVPVSGCQSDVSDFGLKDSFLFCARTESHAVATVFLIIWRLSPPSTVFLLVVFSPPPDPAQSVPVRLGIEFH
jgi:hypothetical protein